MQLSEMGNIAHKFWQEIPKHFPFGILNEFVIMPNHLHGIISINKPYTVNEKSDIYDYNGNSDYTVETRQCLVSTTNIVDITNIVNTTNTKKSIGQKRFQNQGKNTISSIIGSYKSIITKHARWIGSDFAWQPRFHDHIIRNDKSFYNMTNYIINNPMKWEKDEFYEK